MDRTGEQQWNSLFAAGDVPLTLYTTMAKDSQGEPVLEVEILTKPEVPVHIHFLGVRPEGKDT